MKKHCLASAVIGSYEKFTSVSKQWIKNNIWHIDWNDIKYYSQLYQQRQNKQELQCVQKMFLKSGQIPNYEFAEVEIRNT